MNFYTWIGRAGKGAMRTYRTQKRANAEARNSAANAGLWTCGHVHGSTTAIHCGVTLRVEK